MKEIMLKFLQQDHGAAIPEGQVTLARGGYLTESTIFEVRPFVMARYPVTNELFGLFIEAGGYMNPAWWIGDGWAIREKEDWTEPKHWRNSDWNQPDHPVVGISWYEAMAFCSWLSQVMNRQAALPTEQQWQRAAQGDNGWQYPWGNEDPNPELCNWNRYVDETTPVTKYPLGVSPYGVMDMSGNVWEWSLTGWESGTESPESNEARILRGGSWSSDSLLSLRVTNRNPKDPNTRLVPTYRSHVTVGFRYVTV